MEVRDRFEREPERVIVERGVSVCETFFFKVIFGSVWWQVNDGLKK